MIKDGLYIWKDIKRVFRISSVPEKPINCTYQGLHNNGERISFIYRGNSSFSSDNWYPALNIHRLLFLTDDGEET